MQAIQAAQQFAGSLGLGGQPSAGQPPAPTPAGDQLAGVDGGVQPAAPPGQPPPASGGAPAWGADVHAAFSAIGTPAPAAYAHGAMAQPASVDQLGLLLQALRQHQIPALPGPAAVAAPIAPAPAPGAPGMAPAPQVSAIGLLRLILTNPQLQQALQPQATVPRSVALPMPMPNAPGRMRSAQIPLGAVMNAIALLAGQSMTELNEYVSEEEPEVPDYLVDDSGDFIVDPASADDRAALVTHMFRVSNEAQQLASDPQPDSRLDEAYDELDECEEWARTAGLT